MGDAAEVDGRVRVDAGTIAPVQHLAVGVRLGAQFEHEIEMVLAGQLEAGKQHLAHAILGLAREQPLLQPRQHLELRLQRNLADNLPVQVDEDA